MREVEIEEKIHSIKNLRRRMRCNLWYNAIMVTMIQFCPEIEGNPALQSRYHQHVKNIAEWYKKTFDRYSPMLKTEMGMKTLADELKAIDADTGTVSNLMGAFLNDLDYSNSAKMPCFEMSDILVKLILSKYSIGPGRDDGFLTNHGISVRLDYSDHNPRTWMGCKGNALAMIEILTKVLRDEGQSFHIDFQAMNKDRSARNKLTHAGVGILCHSILRYYNIIRDMLVFLNPDYCDLPSYVLEETFDYDKLLIAPSRFSFNDATTILIADTVHDVRPDYRKAVANLPWNLVIDLDGYSDCGGLLESVTHNRIRKEILYRDVADNLPQLPLDTTLWYRCGEYQSFSFILNDNLCGNLSIGAYTAFIKNAPHYKPKISPQEQLNNFGYIFDKLLNCARLLDRFINIVIITDNFNLVNKIMQVLTGSSVIGEDYFVTWVGFSVENNLSTILSHYVDDEEMMREHFSNQSCPIYQFFHAFYDHRDSWMPRESSKSTFSLPGSSGSVILSENERNNLAMDFIALYDHCDEENADRSEELKVQFYSGNTASWNTIANGYIPRLRTNNDFDQMKQIIKTLLGQQQQEPQKRLFFINHTAGIGGTTVARQLVWDLHTEYAVLEVRNYNPKTFKVQIQHLYDNVLDRSPIILLADDTLPFFRNLCDDVCKLERRCILVAACRSDIEILRMYSNANNKSFSSLTDEQIRVIKQRYRDASTLPADYLRKKDDEFSREIRGTMLTPFIIGLYYKEKDFNIHSYVQRALSSCSEKNFAEALALIAMCNYYDYKNIPVSFIRYILGLRRRESFLMIVPAAKSLIIEEALPSGIPCYHFMHPLLSEHYLNSYCEKYYGNNNQRPNMIYSLSLTLIKQIAEATGHLPENVPHLDILISIMIQNKNTDDDNQYNLSKLMKEIAIPENQRELLRKMIEAFVPLADKILSSRSTSEITWEQGKRNEQQILRLVSHAYAHLGRMYSRVERNHLKAYEALQKAIEYMPDHDPNIYHMAGNALLDKLKQRFEQRDIDEKSVKESRQDVENAMGYFNHSIYYGSPEYGYPSKLELLYRYLQYQFNRNKIHSEADLTRLDSFSRQLQSEFLKTLEEAKNYSDFDEIASNRIDDLENRFNSYIIFGNYSKAVEYYQSKVDSLRSSPDLVGYGNSLRCLIFAQINQARKKNPNVPFIQNIKDTTSMLENIETLLNQSLSVDSLAEYSFRTQMFHYWMLLAKHTDISVDKGIFMAKRWVEMESERHHNLNPEPYYYLKTLLYLSLKSGSASALGELHGIMQRVSHYEADGQFDRRRGDPKRIRDLLVEGREMAQLLDVTDCRSEDQMVEALARQSRKFIPVSAHFEENIHDVTAILHIYDPSCWKTEYVRMSIGRRSRNSITSAQKGHRLRFIMGFSTSYLKAISQNVADIDSGEQLDISKISEEQKSSRGRLLSSKTESSISIETSQTKAKRAAVLKTGTQNRPFSVDRRKTDDVNDGLSGNKQPSHNADHKGSDSMIEAKAEPSVAEIPNGTVVLVAINKIQSDVALGTFDYQSNSYEISIKIKGKKDKQILQKAVNQKKKLRIRIISFKEIYLGKII